MGNSHLGRIIQRWYERISRWKSHLDWLSFRDEILHRLAQDFSAEPSQHILSFTPAPHRFTVGASQWFVSSALDCLYLPAMIGKTARVASVCPTTGQDVALTITPGGVETFHPAPLVVSVVVPDKTSAPMEEDLKGADDPYGTLMHFFSSRQAALLWLMPYPKVTVLSLQDTWHLVKEVWIDPFENAMAVADEAEIPEPGVSNR